MRDKQTRVPGVGVVAVTADSIHGIRTTRHHMLGSLAKIFQVGWLEPAAHWRRTGRETPLLASSLNGDRVADVQTTGVDGVIKLDPLAYVPDFYSPVGLRKAFRGYRYRRAAESMRAAGCERVLLHVWRPEFADALDSRNHYDGVIYHVDDEYSFSDVPVPVSPAERRLLEEADAVIVHSQGLAERKAHFNESTYVVPNGVDYGLYTQSFGIPPDLAAIPRPRIGYAGVIRKHNDIVLIRELAERCRQWSFVLVGPLGQLAGSEAEIERLGNLPNVFFLGYRNPQVLPAYQKHFDVCIMPYCNTAYTDCIYPLKVQEYLACGKPIVGSPIRTLLEFSAIIALASGVDEWIEQIQLCLGDEANGDEYISKRKAVAAQYDWKILAQRTARIMASLVDEDTERRVLEGTATPACLAAYATDGEAG
jgi:glycosyltransferase involved in cell wall biosynthesis